MSSPPKIKKTSAVTPHKTMRGHTHDVYGVAHLPDGKRTITCSFDNSLRLWDIESGAQIGEEWRDEGDESGMRAMALSPNGKDIASESYNGTVKLWDVKTGKVVHKWKGHYNLVMSVCWSPDGERVVSGSRDGTARVWDVKHAKRGESVQGLNPIKTGHIVVCAVSYSPKAKMIATGGLRFAIWDAKTGELLSKIELQVFSLAWTSNEKNLLAGTFNGSIRIFDTATWQQIAVLDGHMNPVYSLTLSNDRLLASTSLDETARLWNLDTNLQIGPPLQHDKSVNRAAFSADGKLLSTTCDGGNVYVWDIQAILNSAGLGDLLSIPNAPEFTKKTLSDANATRRPSIRPTPCRVPQGFFDGVQNSDPSPPQRRRRSFAPFWGLHPRALLAGLPQPFHRSQPNVDEPTELQQRPGPSTSPRRIPPIVEVPCIDDKKALYVAWRPKPASHNVNAERIKNSKWWARIVLFICCVSPSTDDGVRS